MGLISIFSTPCGEESPSPVFKDLNDPISGWKGPETVNLWDGKALQRLWGVVG